MSGYYEEGAGDKDARDYLTIRQEKRRQDGIEATDRFTAGLLPDKTFNIYVLRYLFVCFCAPCIKGNTNPFKK